MSMTFVLGEEEYGSKVTSGLMGAFFHAVLGKKNDEINGWKINQSDLAKISLTMMEMKKNMQFFEAFVSLFPDSYWAKRLMEDPVYMQTEIVYVSDELAKTLATMVVNNTEFVEGVFV